MILKLFDLTQPNEADNSFLNDSSNLIGHVIKQFEQALI